MLQKNSLWTHLEVQTFKLIWILQFQRFLVIVSCGIFHRVNYIIYFTHYNILLLSVLALDAMDSSGEQHLQIDHNIYKRRLDLEGKPIEEPKKEDIIIRSKNETDVSNAVIVHV